MLFEQYSNVKVCCQCDWFPCSSGWRISYIGSPCLVMAWQSQLVCGTVCRQLRVCMLLGARYISLFMSFLLHDAQLNWSGCSNSSNLLECAVAYAVFLLRDTAMQMLACCTQACVFKMWSHNMALSFDLRVANDLRCTIMHLLSAKACQTTPLPSLQCVLVALSASTAYVYVVVHCVVWQQSVVVWALTCHSWLPL